MYQKMENVIREDLKTIERPRMQVEISMFAAGYKILTPKMWEFERVARGPEFHVNMQKNVNLT